MATSEYQLFKLQFLGLVPLAKDAVHVYIGVLCLLLTVIVARRPLRSFWALVPGLLVSLIMEALDLRDDLSWLGHYRWAASAKDLVNTNGLPLLIVALARWRLLRL